MQFEIIDDDSPHVFSASTTAFSMVMELLPSRVPETLQPMVMGESQTTA